MTHLLRRYFTLLIAVPFLSACQQDGATVPPTPPANVSENSLPELSPLREDEQLLLQARGKGPESLVGTTTSTPLTVLYAVCAKGGKLSIRDVESEVMQQDVPCDGVVSRMQVFTRGGDNVKLSVTGSGESQWRLMLTAAKEP